MKKWRSLGLDELSADLDALYHTLNEESDLACVLIGTSYLAELLATTLKIQFIEGSTSDRLLDPQRGALGNFATRADLAYCLSLISKSVYQDLSRVAEIRNQFAHKHLSLTFKDLYVRAACNDLQAWRIMLTGEDEVINQDPTEEQLTTLARNQFKMTIVFVGMRIHLDALGRSHQKTKGS
jgi:DNA-binding MltR family transcriptional regulator